MVWILNLSLGGELNIFLNEKPNLFILSFEKNGIELYENLTSYDHKNFIPIIKERAQILNGELRISKSLNDCTTISIEIPLLIYQD